MVEDAVVGGQGEGGVGQLGEVGDGVGGEREGRGVFVGGDDLGPECELLGAAEGQAIFFAGDYEFGE